MSSVARAHVAGGNAPVYQGFVNWIGVAESSRDLVDGASIHDYGGMASASASWRWGGARFIGRRRSGAGALGPRLGAAAGAWRAAAAPSLARAGPSRGAVDAAGGRCAIAMGLVRCDAACPLPIGPARAQGRARAWRIRHLARCLEDPAMGSGAAERGTGNCGGHTAIAVRARELFITDPQACRERDARVRASDPLQGVHALAQGWGGACLCPRWRKPGRRCGGAGSGNVGHEMAGRPRGGLD